LVAIFPISSQNLMHTYCSVPSNITKSSCNKHTMTLKADHETLKEGNQL